MRRGVHAVGMALLVVSASFVGVVAFSGTAAADSVSASLSDSHVQSNTTVTVTASEVENGDTVEFRIDADYDGTFETSLTNKTEQDGDGVVNYTFDPSEYRAEQGWYQVQIREDAITTAEVDGEIDDTKPNVSFRLDNPSGQNLSLSSVVWDDVDTYYPPDDFTVQHEDLDTLVVNVSGPDGTKTFSLENGDFSKDEKLLRNESYYNRTYNTTSDGVYNVTLVNATDYADNSNTVETGRSIIIDTDPPDVWNGSSVDATNENGVVDDGDEVVVTANVTDEFLRDVWVNASAFGAGNVTLHRVDENESLFRGNFTVDAQNASGDGTHELVVWADDAGPNYNSTAAGTLDLDTTAPTLANPSPVPDSFVNDSDRNVTLDVTDAHEVNGTVHIEDASGVVLDGEFATAAGVSYENGTLVVNTSEAVAGGEFAEGPVNVSVSAHDPENNTASTIWSFVVDTVSPTITNTSVVDADDGDGVVNDGQNVTVEATVTDEHLLNDSVTADVRPLGPAALDLDRVSGTDRFTATFTVNTTKRVDAESVAFEVSAEDRANNTNTTTAGSVTLDTLAPRLTDTEPDVLFTNDTDTNLSATLNETHLDEVHVVVNASTGTLVDQTVSPADESTTNVTLSGSNATGWHVEVEPGTLPDGNVTGTFTASDVDGNVTTENVSFVVDTRLPAFENVSIADSNNGNGYVADGNAVNVSFTLDERYPDSVWANATPFGAGTKNLTGQSEPYTWTFTVDVHPGDDGERSDALLNATDLAGNVNATHTATLTVDLTEPTFDDATPTGTVVDTAEPNVTVDVRNERNALDTENVTATFTDADGTHTVDIAGANDGVTFETWNDTTNGTLTVNVSAANFTLADGDVNVTVAASDVDGNTNETTFGFVVDTTAPVFSEVSLTDADGDGVVNDGDTVTVTATLDEPHPDAAWANASAFGVDRVNLTQVSGTPTPTFEGNFTVNGSAMADDGPHDVEVTAVDTVNNTNRTTTANLTVDSTSPEVWDATVTDETDGNGYVNDGDTVSVAVNVSDANAVAAVSAGATLFGVGTVTLSDADGDGRYTATFEVNTSESVSTETRIEVMAVDTTGNTNQTTTGPIFLDTVPPENASGVAADPITLRTEDAYPVTVDLPSDHQNLTVSVRLSNGGETVTESVRANSTAETATVTLNATALPEGSVDVAVRLTDLAGNHNPGGYQTLETVTKDTVRPRAASAHTTAGATEVYLAASELLAERTYGPADVEFTGHQNVTDVALRGGDLLVVTLGSAVTESQLSNDSVTLALDEDVADRVGNGAPTTGANVTLTDGATAIRSVDATVDSDTVAVYFNGPVYAGDGGGLVASNFTYRDANGAGARTVTNVSHAAGDVVAYLTLATAVTADDLGTDELHIDDGAVYNDADQSIGAQTVTLADTRPATLGSYSLSTKQDEVLVTFTSDEPLDTVTASVEAAYAPASTTLTDSDFTAAESDGTYYYRATYEAPGDGRYNVTLTTARDYGGNSPTSLPLNATADVDTQDPRLTDARISDVGTHDGEVYTNLTLSVSEPVEFRTLTTDNVSFDGTSASVLNVTHDTLGGNESVGDTVTVTVAGEFDTETAPDVVLGGTVVEATGDRATMTTQSSTVYALVRTLEAGNNFVSFPIESGSVPVSSLDLTGVDVVWTYEDGAWQSYDPGAPTNTLTEIRGGQGYIFQMNAQSTLRLTFDNVAPTGEHDSVRLEPGWNLVGHWQEGRQPTSQALASVENVTTVHQHTGPVLEYGPTDRFVPGDGYWVYVNGTAAQTYTVAPYENETAGGA